MWTWTSEDILDLMGRIPEKFRSLIDRYVPWISEIPL